MSNPKDKQHNEAEAKEKKPLAAPAVVKSNPIKREDF